MTSAHTLKCPLFSSSSALAGSLKMASTGTFYDPLTINLEQQTLGFLGTLPQISTLHTTLLTAPTRPELLHRLSRALLLPEHTIAVSNYFRPILLDLCARWLEDEMDEENKLEALCLLLDLHPEIFPCVIVRDMFTI